ncbi:MULTISPECIES: bifunctional 2-polyprenyl-6-hydroxyphenol methylase/3-demethylubiquinol 3-O-methyltransferase UbiG [unclassified Kitasatospora]|uniref:class I SAM-dependent methyltransferase n=1 Tax=unclassified Kitasatospora TaxID=2633591 RepID=UPI00070B3F10|nr:MULTISPECIES: class I SAM-dependent methyltransferase [unclassified Kitasatospora]KQV20835.1 hypothetical protein ASC99_20210 [Kitasatospora sp. Root107]KRB60508.1 hypothetical protein ASE03_12965 [Kitasatospora sp. Root187]
MIGTGRHRRPAAPAAGLVDLDQRLRAVADGTPVVEEGVARLGGDAVFLYRTSYEPDGSVHQELTRADAVGWPFPPLTGPTSSPTAPQPAAGPLRLRRGDSMEDLSDPDPWDADFRDGARFRTVTDKEVDLLAQHLHRPIAGLTVLDVCCGTGELTSALGERGATVTGVDFAPTAITAARERCAHLPGAVFRELDANRALDELPAHGFDVVAFRLALAFLDQQAVLAAARRRLTPDGLIAVTTPLAERQADGRHHIGLDHTALQQLRTGWSEVTEYPLGSLLCLLLRP